MNGKFVDPPKMPRPTSSHIPRLQIPMLQGTQGRIQSKQGAGTSTSKARVHYDRHYGWAEVLLQNNQLLVRILMLDLAQRIQNNKDHKHKKKKEDQDV